MLSFLFISLFSHSSWVDTKNISVNDIEHCLFRVSAKTKPKSTYPRIVYVNLNKIEYNHEKRSPKVVLKNDINAKYNWQESYVIIENEKVKTVKVGGADKSHNTLSVQKFCH